MKRFKKIFQWTFVVFCLLAVFSYGFCLGSVFLVVTGVLSMPIKPIRELWEKVLKGKRLKTAILTIMFFVSILAIPAENIPEQDSDLSNGVVEEESNTDLEENQEDIIIGEVDDDSEEDDDAIVENQDDKADEEVVVTPNNLSESKADLSTVKKYSGNTFVALNDNLPSFTVEDLVNESYEKYSNLDSLGRCGVVYACVGEDIMPTEERGSIGQVKPSGWHTVKYDNVDGKYLYNRCHLIGYQLTGENANEQNLITGTRYMNTEGMLPFENMVADYIKETGNHVLYRVTPYFIGNNLIATGVQLEGYSVEDEGEGICFNVFVYNVQPGITIDYATGESRLADGDKVDSTDKNDSSSTSDKTDSNKNESGSSDSQSSSNKTENDKNNSDVQEPEDEVLVWKSATGEKYHAINNCGRMNPNKARQITKEKAEDMGLEPCSKCF